MKSSQNFLKSFEHDKTNLVMKCIFFNIKCFDALEHKFLVIG